MGDKAMKRLISIMLTLMTLVCVGFVGCEKDNKETYDDFVYCVEYYDKNNVRVSKEEAACTGVIILGLSKKGKSKEIIVVPEQINGIDVKEIGDSLWLGAGIWKSNQLKKVFIPFSVIIYQAVFYHCNTLEKIILFANETSGYKSDDTVHKKGNGIIPVFLTSFNCIETNKTNFYDYCNGSKFFYFSNVTFVYNYENAPNDGYYWIDDCDYGGRIEYIPEPPVRDGYKFGGWYKQADCIEEWNFETDTLPEAEYTEENDEVYQETKLYAKWKRI